jgi:plastocyanin
MNKLILYKVQVLAIATILPLLLFISGCSKDEPIADVNKSYTVDISQMKFTPETLEVNKGDTVTWVNKDYVQHDITDESNKSWTSGPLDKDMKWSKIITKDEDYFCSIHVVMKGKIRVKN